ncbi:MAG: NAD(P)H-dependent oxidoreductase subunit E [Desulfomicrobium escambiense]|nr:NAD(P)H-dependent oxidoreductase subunit E [Desulfomicrobium escambiense]
MKRKQVDERTRNRLGQAAMDNDRIDQIIDKHHGEPSYLIQVLLDIQSENHWLPKEALEKVGRDSCRFP